MASRSRAGWLHLATIAVLVVFSFLQRVGEATFDTKFDLTQAPGQMLARSLHLWNPWQNFGELQNQAYGYLFPQGLWFWLLELTGTPDWVTQRLWSAAVLLVAYEGCRRLHRAMVPDRPVLSVVAGLAFALSPRLLGLSGVLSAEVLPTAVLPWVALPLVLGLSGRLSPRSAGLLSGVPVLFMGGVNAVENLAALPLAFFLVVAGLRRPGGRALAGWWTAATTAACLWWFLPLLVMGRYSPMFLNYIETSAATTRPLGWFNSVRGADHWLAFLFVGGEPWWPGAYDLAVEPALVILTALVAAFSLFGLFSTGMPWRGPLVSSAVLGLILLTVAHAGVGSSPLDAWVRGLLDGSLAPLRNVHKVDPLVRLPLALGLAHGLGMLVDAVRAPAILSRVGPRGRHAPAVACGLVLALLAASAAPLFTDRLRKSGWEQMPEAWLELGDYLEASGDDSAALLLPGSGFGQQWWGWTIDQPIQGATSAPWAVRSQVPLVPGATLRFLDSVESRVSDGVGSLSLADTLAGAGVGWVVVRRDLDYIAAEVPAPNRVDASVARSPGFDLAASFGRSGFGDQAMLDLYRVTVPVPEAEAPLTESLASVAGAPEDLVTARELGVIEPERRAVFGPRPPDVVGDGYRRQERQFGRLHDALSQVMTADEPYRLRRAAHDYAGLPGERPVVADYDGLDLVAASSSSGYADALGPIRPEVGPASVVDRDRTTFWQSAPFQDPEGQWVELRFPRPVTPTGLNVVAGVDTVSGAPVRRVEVRAGDQRRTVGVDPVTGEVRVSLDGSPVSRIRVTVAGVWGDPDEAVVALREVRALGVPVTRTLVIPDVEADDSTAFVFRAQPGRRACVTTALGPTCSPGEARARLEQLEMRRRLEVGSGGSWVARGTVTARPTPEAAALLDPLGGGITATASSTLGGDPLVSARFAVDGDASTPWLADTGDLTPELRLRWDRPRRLDRIYLEPAPGQTRAPSSVVLVADGQRRVVDLGPGSFGVFRPVRTESVRIRLGAGEAQSGDSRPTGVGEVRLSGLGGLARPVRPRGPTGAPCGLGPEVVVDGEVHPTEVTGTIGDVLDGTPLEWRVCDGPLDLEAGIHDVVVESTVQYAAERLTLEPEERELPPLRTRDVTRTAWASNAQGYRVEAGDEAVLRVPQNFNQGWQAEADGSPLDPMVVDGWQQGFRLPARTEAMDVQLVYAPDRWYRLALLIGLVAAVALMAAAAWSVRRDRRDPVASTGASSASRAPRPRRAGRWWAFAGSLALVAGGLVLGGPYLAAGLGSVVLVGQVAPRLVPASAAVGATVVALAGVVAGVTEPVAPGMPGAGVDVATAVALGILVAGAWPGVARPVDPERSARWGS